MRRNLLLPTVGAAIGAAVLTWLFVAVDRAGDEDVEAANAGNASTLLAALPGPDRAVYIQAVAGTGNARVLSVSVAGKVSSFPMGAGAGERELFVLSPIKGGSDKYLLKTAYARVGGKWSCLTARGGPVFTNVCDPSEWAQTVQFRPGSAGTFDLLIGGNAIELAADGTVGAEDRGAQAAMTRFGFVDGGTAPDA
jgi:hypothetical protein